MNPITNTLDQALINRHAFFDDDHYAALRLFNGFLEGFPSLAIDIYARTALIHNYEDIPEPGQIPEIQNWIHQNLPWVQCIICKTRNAPNSEGKRGVLLSGTTPDTRVRENGTWYAIDLTLNRDASLYLDTRNLRNWVQRSLKGKTLLNTFAYTGSFGVAALAGGAARVVQLDRNRGFLDIAKKSYLLNNFAIRSKDIMVNDFFPGVSQLKKSGQGFDCVILDPPFFASTSKGKVDLETGSTKLINKIRPLVNHEGWIIAINNALFISGKEYLASLESLCTDGYLTLEQLIPVPEDFTGFAPPSASNAPSDPAPFNHSTKIAVLRVKRKANLHPDEVH